MNIKDELKNTSSETFEMLKNITASEEFSTYLNVEEQVSVPESLIKEGYKEFTAIESAKPQIYLDYKGNPTIGVGHLIFPLDLLKNESNPKSDEAKRKKQSLAEYKQKFIELPLYKGDKLLNNNEKGKLFDLLVTELRKAANSRGDLSSGLRTTGLIVQKEKGAGYKICVPSISSINMKENGIYETFKKDFIKAYNQTVNAIGQDNFNKCSTLLKLAAIHYTFRHGKASIFKGKKTPTTIYNAIPVMKNNDAFNDLLNRAGRRKAMYSYMQVVIPERNYS